MTAMTTKWKSKSSLLLIFKELTSVLQTALDYKKQELTLQYQGMLVRAFNHEIRHPLNSIQTLTVLEENKIRKNIESKEELLEILKIIRNESSSLQFLSQNLQDYQDIQNESFELQFQYMDIERVIE